MSHEYAGITFSIHGPRGEEGSVTVPAPKRFYRRWAMWVAVWLWTWATGTVTDTDPVDRRG